ncbi:MAG TPA: hypothetical protein VIV40_15500 [Kofleriaceae bacterium]
MMALGGCAADDGSTAEISNEMLTGSVGGQAWSFKAGHTSAFLSEGEPDFFATLYPATFTTCGFSEPGGNHLIVSIPKTVGEYEMSLSRNMTFVVGDSNNLIATKGRIVVDEVTATSVKGGLVSSYDGQNEVNGRFEVTICPD